MNLQDEIAVSKLYPDANDVHRQVLSLFVKHYDEELSHADITKQIQSSTFFSVSAAIPGINSKLEPLGYIIIVRNVYMYRFTKKLRCIDVSTSTSSTSTSSTSLVQQVQPQKRRLVEAWNEYMNELVKHSEDEHGVNELKKMIDDLEKCAASDHQHIKTLELQNEDLKKLLNAGKEILDQTNDAARKTYEQNCKLQEDRKHSTQLLIQLQLQVNNLKKIVHEREAYVKLQERELTELKDVKTMLGKIRGIAMKKE